MPSLDEILHYATDTQFVDRSVLAWGIAALIAVLVILVLPIARRVLRAFGTRHPGSIRGLIGALGGRWLFISTLGAAVGLAAIPLDPSDRLAWFLRVVLVVLAGIQVMVWSRVVIDWVIGRYLAARAGDDGSVDPALAGTMATFRWMAQVVIGAAVVLLALQNVGVDVTALIAGLGIGGIAVALAAQNVLGDLFSSLSITLDKPFVVGDFIIVGSEMGTIEHIGLKTTRVRSLSGEQLVFGNSDLLGSRIRNFKRMQRRRVSMSFGVTYQTPVPELERIPEIARACVATQSLTAFDRCHFMRFGDSSLDFELVYYVESPDMTQHMDRLQGIQLELMRRFAARGIEFAYPTRTLYVVNSNESSEGDRANDRERETAGSGREGRGERR